MQHVGEGRDWTSLRGAQMYPIGAIGAISQLLYIYLQVIPRPIPEDQDREPLLKTAQCLSNSTHGNRTRPPSPALSICEEDGRPANHHTGRVTTDQWHLFEALFLQVSSEWERIRVIYTVTLVRFLNFPQDSHVCKSRFQARLWLQPGRLSFFLLHSKQNRIKSGGGGGVMELIWPKFFLKKILLYPKCVAAFRFAYLRARTWVQNMHAPPSVDLGFCCFKKLERGDLEKTEMLVKKTQNNK